LSAEERRELELLLHALDLPKLARCSGKQGSGNYGVDLRAALDDSRTRHKSMTPEQLAAEKAEKERDEDELLEWRNGRGKDYKFSSELKADIVDAHCRLARWRHEQRDAVKADLNEWSEMQRHRVDEAMRPRPATDYMRDTPRAQRIDAPVSPEAIPEPQPVAAARQSADFVDIPVQHVSARAVAQVLESLDGIDKRERAWRERHAIGGGWGT
jgi:hypothetical protein